MEEIFDDKKIIEYEHDNMIINDNFVFQIVYADHAILRAYANSYYWLLHKKKWLNIHNLGFYSNTQNYLINKLMWNIVDWCNNSNNNDTIKKIYSIIFKNNTDDLFRNYASEINYVMWVINDYESSNNYFVLLWILNNIHSFVIVLYNKNDDIMCVFDKNNGIITFDENKIKLYNDFKFYINIKINTTDINEYWKNVFSKLYF